MNISQAKQIPLRQIIEVFGGRFSHNGRLGETWYFSPFRPDEKTASFKVDEKANTWHDFARTEKVDAHGDILDLWTDFHNKPRKDSEAIKQALSVLESFNTAIIPDRKTSSNSKSSDTKRQADPRYIFLKPPSKIWMDSLKTEIVRRGLTLAIVMPHLKQAYIKDTKTSKTYNGFAFKNEKGGYDISIPNPHTGKAYKTGLGPKGITVIATTQYNSAFIFEGFWDFFSWIQIDKGYKDYCYIILNSASNVNAAIEILIKQKNTIASVFSFLDNDNAGEKATHQLAVALEPEGFVFGTKNHIYEGYKDLNEYLMNRTDNKKIWIRNANKFNP